jgi:hypothetical protein
MCRGCAPSIPRNSTTPERHACLRRRFVRDALRHFIGGGVVEAAQALTMHRPSDGQPHAALLQCTPHGMPCDALQTAASLRRRPQFTINAQRRRAAMTPQRNDGFPHRHSET